MDVSRLFSRGREDVEKVVEFCRRGPPGAYVRGLDLKWERWIGEFLDFRVTR